MGTGTTQSTPSTFELGIAFRELSMQLGDYRLKNRKKFSPDQYQHLQDDEWTLLNMASDLNAKSLLDKADMLAKDLKTLQSVTKEMKTAIGNISKAKHAIDIATKSVALGGAIYLAASTGNIPLVIGAAGELIDVIQETQKG